MEAVTSWLCCKVCSNAFSETNTPLAFPCGHSCCKYCLEDILDGVKSEHICHECKASLPHARVKKYPVNCSLLEASVDIQTSYVPYLTEGVHKRLLALQTMHTNVLNQFVQTNRKIPALLQLIENKKKISELRKKVTGGAYGIAEELRATLNSIEALIENEADSHACGILLQFKLDYHSSKFDDPKLFLSEILTEVNNGKKIIAHSIFLAKDIFARISVKDGRSLCIHCFDDSELKSEDSKTVKFNDLNAAFRKIGIFVFMTFPHFGEKSSVGTTLFIEIVDIAHVRAATLDIFTGDKGISLADCPYQIVRQNIDNDNSDDELTNNKATGINNTPDIILLDSSKRIKYFEQLRNNGVFSVALDPNEHLVKIKPEGIIEISAGNEHDLIVVGKVFKRVLIEGTLCNTSKFNITECGVLSTI